MEDSAQKTVLRWWQSMVMSPAQLNDLNIIPAPSAHKAQLRRCESADAVMLTEGFRALWLRLDDNITASANSNAIECWATIASALVYVNENGKDNLASVAGRPEGGDKSQVSEMRFAKLQGAKTPDDFLRRLRRIIQQVKGEVSVVKLAADIQQWFFEHNSIKPRNADKRISVQWAMDYYRSASTAVKTKK